MKAMFWFSRGRAKLKTKTKLDKAAVEGKLVERLWFREREVQIVRRAYRRRIGLTLQVNGCIRVVAPKTVPLSYIQQFLQEHDEWIETNLQRYQGLRDTYPPKSYRAGEKFLFLGREIVLRFEMKSSLSRPQIEVREGDLIVSLPVEMGRGFKPEESHPELAPLIVAFFEKAGRQLLTQRLQHYSEKMELRPTSVSFRAQKTRWGSCSAVGRISLNWRLIVAPLPVVDYVVVHELSHLRHYNHSAAFWNLVGTQVPRYAELRNWLRKHQYEADFLAKKSELHAFR